MKIGSYPKQSEIKDLFSYTNGHLLWKKNEKIAGCFDKYNTHKPPRIQINGKLYYLNRLIWIYHNSSLSKEDIIFCIDNNPHNCRIENLAKILQEDYHKMLHYSYKAGLTQ
tara:strand:+ start:33 stop:365 length:333 start_codon:yes stop_codon:yes gene_type:complete